MSSSLSALELLRKDLVGVAELLKGCERDGEKPEVPHFDDALRQLRVRKEEEEEEATSYATESTHAEREALGRTPDENQLGVGEATGTGVQPRGAEREKYDPKHGDAFLRKHGIARIGERGQWSRRRGKKPGHDGKTLVPRNPQVIRARARAHGAIPSKAPGGDADRTRERRFDLPGRDKSPQHLSRKTRSGSREQSGLVFVLGKTDEVGPGKQFPSVRQPVTRGRPTGSRHDLPHRLLSSLMRRPPVEADKKESA